MNFNTNLSIPQKLNHAAVSSVTDGVQALHLTTNEPRKLVFTENQSPTFSSTGNPCLDFFFHVVPNTASNSLIERLSNSWSFDPLTTLKLVCNLRGVRGTGKSDREGFYVAAWWLHKSHPKTLACNAWNFAQFGCYKDLMEILKRLVEEEDDDDKMEVKREGINRKSVRFSRRVPFFKRKQLGKARFLIKPTQIEKFEEETKIIRVTSKDDSVSKAKKAFERYKTDPIYRFLHDSVAAMFAEDLKKDLHFMHSNEIYKISLASKWCPSIDSSYDRTTLICENIARRIFPKDSDPEYQGIADEHYAYRVRDRLRKQVLVPLRKALELPEIYMEANKWQSIPYEKVSSVAMKNYRDLFLKHDKARFEEYLESVKTGEMKMAAAALLPHEIVAALKDDDEDLLAEMQWKTMVDDMSKNGKLKNCMAICDVSHTMYGTPMDVSVSLGLLISELSEEPWKGKIITFQDDPEIHMIKGSNLHEKAKFIREMEKGRIPNLQKVFDRILKVAVAGGLSEEQMIKKIFIFSDMEFYQDYRNEWACFMRYRYWGRVEELKEGWKRSLRTDYEEIEKKFREKGYSKVPEIVFWNLRDSPATPALAEQSGVQMVSGFSKDIMKIFLENEGNSDPISVMNEAISGEMYEKLVVYD